MVIITNDPGATRALGQRLGQLLRPGDVLSVAGEMGAGKTTFIQGLAQGIGIEDYITSPTFTIIHEHQGPLPLYHIDAYRLEEPDEGVELGLEEYLGGPGVTAVEWAERIAPWLPDNYLQVSIKALPDQEDGRQIHLEEQGAGGYAKLLEELRKLCKF